MADRRSRPDASAHDLIRARRIEIVDDFGHARIVVGDLSLDADYDYWPGLVIRSPEGRDRAWLMLHPDGIQLEFDLGGNTIASFGVLDHHSAHPGSDLVLCNVDGTAVIGCHVNPDGTTEVTHGQN